MATDVGPFPHVDDHPALREAQAQRAPVHAALEAARARQREIGALVDPMVERPVRPNRAAYLRALAEQAEIEQRVDLLTAQDEELQASEAAAREVAVEELRAQFVEADAEDVRDLVGLLLRARAVEARRIDRWTRFEAAANGRQPDTNSALWIVFRPDGLLDGFIEWARRERALDTK